MLHVNNVQQIRVKMIRIAAIRLNFCLLLLSNSINVGIGYNTACNTMRVYHPSIITWATADSFCSLFSYPHNPRSHTWDYVTHMTVNGPGVTSQKVRYGSWDFKVTRKKPAVRHIHVKKNDVFRDNLTLSMFLGVQNIYSNNCTAIRRQWFINTWHYSYKFRPTIAIFRNLFIK
jgi:hypothetical protein